MMKIRKHKRKYTTIAKDCWNLDYSFCEWVLPRLKHFRNNSHSYPGIFSPDLKDQSVIEHPFVVENKLEHYFVKHADVWYGEEYDLVYADVHKEIGFFAWCNIIDDMIKGFEARLVDDIFTESKEFNKAMELFKLFINDLWD
jgi:hypothetical protein